MACRKSQLAIEYSYQIRSESPDTWVFWVHASNETRFEQSFREIADQLKLPRRDDPKTNIFELVQSWLQDRRKGKWVCILDNVDDEFVCAVPAMAKDDQTKARMSKPLLEYVPKSHNGFTIITSRSREVALKMVDHNDLINVEPMERSEALELLRTKLQSPAESQESLQLELVIALESMPLAITQAASYIRHRAPRCSISQYLKSFLESDYDAIRLLKMEAGHPRRDWEASNSILRTWQISFNHLCQTRPSATNLLSLMSFFDRQSIPEALLKAEPSESPEQQEHDDPVSLLHANTNSNEATARSTAAADFEDDITTLRDYSFISIGENETFFTMHRLVQLTTCEWLRAHGQLQRWQKIFISNLYREFPISRHGNLGACRTLFPHVKSALSQRPESPDALLQWAALLHRGARYSCLNSNLSDAKEMALSSRMSRLTLLGPQNQDTILSTKILARIYLLEEMWDEAEKLFLHVIDTCKASYGEDNPATLLAMANLASTYRNQGKFDKAEKLLLQVVNDRERILGADHPSTISATSNLGSVYRKQNRLEESEQLLSQVVERSKVRFGKDHPSTLLSMANLASTFKEQGQWEKVDELEIHVMEARRKGLEQNGLYSLKSVASFASTHLSRGQWEEAETLLLELVETRKRILGNSHPATIRSMKHLALAYRGQDRFEEAETLELQVKETSGTKLDGNDP